MIKVLVRLSNPIVHTAMVNKPFSIYKAERCIILAIKGDLSDSSIAVLEKAFFEFINQEKQYNAVIIDVSEVRVIDTFIFKHIAELAKIAEYLGFQVAACGFKPAVASALSETVEDVEIFPSFANLEAALAYFTH